MMGKIVSDLGDLILHQMYSKGITSRAFSLIPRVENLSGVLILRIYHSWVMTVLLDGGLPRPRTAFVNACQIRNLYKPGAIVPFSLFSLMLVVVCIELLLLLVFPVSHHMSNSLVCSFGCVLSWSWFSPSIFWWLLMGSCFEHLMYDWVDTCSWMWLGYIIYLYMNDIDLMVKSLCRPYVLSLLTMMFLIGRLLLWYLTGSWLFVCDFRIGSFIMLGCVVNPRVAPFYGEQPWSIAPHYTRSLSFSLVIISNVICQVWQFYSV